MALLRTQISLSEEERRVLDAAGRRTGRSMSALIREAIQATYGAPGRGDRVRAAIDLSFNISGVEIAGAEAVDGIRSGRRLERTE